MKTLFLLVSQSRSTGAIVKEFGDTTHAIEKAIRVKTYAIKDIRDEKAGAPIKFNVNQVEKEFSCTEKARADINAKANSNSIKTARQIAFQTHWLTTSGEELELTPTELEDLGFAMEAQVEKAIFDANTHMVALEAIGEDVAKTVVERIADIEAYDISLGWN